jgi:hypothetical protein
MSGRLLQFLFLLLFFAPIVPLPVADKVIPKLKKNFFFRHIQSNLIGPKKKKIDE